MLLSKGSIFFAQRRQQSHCLSRLQHWQQLTPASMKIVMRHAMAEIVQRCRTCEQVFQVKHLDTSFPGEAARPCARHIIPELGIGHTSQDFAEEVRCNEQAVLTSKMLMDGWWIVQTIVLPVLTMFRTCTHASFRSADIRERPACNCF